MKFRIKSRQIIFCFSSVSERKLQRVGVNISRWCMECVATTEAISGIFYGVVGFLFAIFWTVSLFVLQNQTREQRVYASS
jgi:hypothetical protein